MTHAQAWGLTENLTGLLSFHRPQRPLLLTRSNNGGVPNFFAMRLASGTAQQLQPCPVITSRGAFAMSDPRLNGRHRPPFGA